MPTLRPFEQIDAGGVDSRSNPINMPRNRALRCLNWVPVQAGFWQLRWGYTSVTMSTVTATAIHSMFPYRTWNGNKYVLFMQGTVLNVLNTSTGVVTTPTVLGTPIASSAKGAGFFANNRFHYGNGTDQKWFDATNWRDSGLASLTSTQIAGVTIAEGVRELTTVQASSVTLTAAAGGSFPADTLTGHLMYVAIFDTSVNEIGPATISVASGRIKVVLNNKITVAVMPDLSGVNTNWVKLIGGTIDGGNVAYFFTNTSTNVVSCSRVSTTLTVVATAHGLASNDVVILAGTLNFDGVYNITVLDVNTFTVVLPGSNTSANTSAVGTVKRIVKAGNAVTTIDVLAPTQDTSYQVNQNRGLAASTIGGTQPGYQFYASLYNPTGGGHVGNRIAIGNRALQTGYRSNWRIAGLPVLNFGGTIVTVQVNAGGGGNSLLIITLSAPPSITLPTGTALILSGLTTRTILNGIIATVSSVVGNVINFTPFAVPGGPYGPAGDTGTVSLQSGSPLAELTVLIGRTGDGALVPYPCTDPAGNWAFMLSSQTSITITQPITDGQHELPTRNGVIPSQCNMFAVAGDYCYAADTGSPTLRRSGSLADDRAGTFTGRPEQSWAPDDIDSFPTGEAMTGIFEVDQEIFCGTLHDSAVSVNLAGIQQWVGPWQIGIAGIRAGTKCGSHGFFWVSGDKQLCTLEQGVPVPVSEEYELAELSQIGDLFLPTVEVVYYRSAIQNKDEVRIEAQKQDGTPYTIIHDFKLREYGNAPGSLYGQGYSSQFQGPLGTVFTSATVRDSTGTLRIYSGASTGQLYQLYSGADDVGNQYTADAILLLNGGPDRPNVAFVDFYGDQNILITVGRNLQTSLALGSQWGFDPPSADVDMPQSVPGAEQDFLYRIFLVPPEVQRLYLRFVLTSHSADGNLNPSSPPHLPLENYGRLYEFIPAVGDERTR